jgi:hypothetical protein
MSVYHRRMPFKDTPGLRRNAMAAIEARDVVSVRLVSDWTFLDTDGVLYRKGQILLLRRSWARDLEARGHVEVLD